MKIIVGCKEEWSIKNNLSGGKEARRAANRELSELLFRPVETYTDEQLQMALEWANRNNNHTDANRSLIAEAKKRGWEVM